MSAVPVNELETLRDWLRWAVSRFTEAGLAFSDPEGLRHGGEFLARRFRALNKAHMTG